MLSEWESHPRAEAIPAPQMNWGSVLCQDSPERTVLFLYIGLSSNFVAELLQGALTWISSVEGNAKNICCINC